MRHRRIFAVACVLVALVSIAGSGSVSSVHAERDLSVSVVDDSEAFLGIEQRVDRERGPTLTLHNKLPGGETLTVVIRAGDDEFTQVISPGASATTSLEGASCGSVLDISAESESMSVDATRTLECSDSTSGEDEDGGDEDGDDEDGDD